MFVYKDFLGVIGGCPVGQHFQELALLDLQSHTWKQVTLDYIGKELLVRTTANVVGDDLVIIGGGAACYAFGTKFSKPFKVNLLPLVPLGDKLMPTEKNVNFRVSHAENAEALTQSPVMNFEAEKHQLVSYNRVLQLEKKYAKMGKDILKNFGWLDLGRKVYTKEDGLHICFPITEKFSAMFLKKHDQDVDVFEEGNDTFVCKPFTGGGILLNEVSCSTALNFLKKCGATNLANEVGAVRKSSKSPFQTMNESIALLIKQKDLAETLLEQLPNRLVCRELYIFGICCCAEVL
jgi:tRNA wybutosine-synthesizing protein 3